MVKKSLFIAVVSLVVMNACVPVREYQELQDKHDKSNDEKELLVEENDNLNTINTELDAKIKVLDKEVKTLVEDSTTRAANITQLKYNLDKIQKQYDDLQFAQDALLKGSASETRKLLEELQKTQEDLQIQEDALRELEKRLNARKRNLETLQGQLEIKDREITKKNNELEARNARMLELERILFEKDSLVDALKNKVSAALMGYEGRGLSITQKDGKVYVSLDEKLLFRSGSANVDPKGQAALKDLAVVLAENPDINVLVEGHTDDVPYNGTGKVKDNWDLSVLRATSVVKILLTNPKLDPVRVIAGGRSKFIPLDNAKTTEARAKNRRTEIILTPNIDELYRLLNE